MSHAPVNEDDKPAMDRLVSQWRSSLVYSMNPITLLPSQVRELALSKKLVLASQLHPGLGSKFWIRERFEIIDSYDNGAEGDFFVGYVCLAYPATFYDSEKFRCEAFMGDQRWFGIPWRIYNGVTGQCFRGKLYWSHWMPIWASRFAVQVTSVQGDRVELSLV